MPVKWRLFWIVCLLQMLAAAYFSIMELISFFQAFAFSGATRTLLFILIFLLSILAINLLNNNYPDQPVSGRQKTQFNRLFLLNFLFLAILFGIIFSEYRQMRNLATLYGNRAAHYSFGSYLLLLTYTGVLLLQLVILYGLYVLRRELYANFMNKEFEFEKDQLR